MAKKEIENKKNNKQKSHFFKDMKAELKKVIWPSAKQTANNTLAVIAFTLILAAIVFVLDVAFDFANKKGVVALQEKVKSSYSTNNTTVENTTEENTSSENTSTETKTENATEVEAETSTENSTNTENKK